MWWWWWMWYCWMWCWWIWWWCWWCIRGRRIIVDVPTVTAGDQQDLMKELVRTREHAKFMRQQYESKVCTSHIHPTIPTHTQ